MDSDDAVILAQSLRLMLSSELAPRTAAARAKDEPAAAAVGRAVSVRTDLLLIASLGAVSGWMDALLSVYGRFAHPISEVSRDEAWLTPTVSILLFASLGVLTAVAVRIAPARWRRHTRLAGMYGATVLALLALMLHIPRVHHAALLVLAAGLAARVTPALLRFASRKPSHIRNVFSLQLMAVVLVAGAVRGGRFVRESVALHGLAPAAADAPNVVVVTIDAGRAFNMSVYGYERATTPWLESLAARGVTFDRALATATWTLPAHASLFTGRWHHEISADYETPLDDTFVTLAEYLSRRGYVTGGFAANLRYVGYETGLDRGFVHYDDYPLSLSQALSGFSLTRTVLNHFRLRDLIRNDQHLVRRHAADLNRAVFRWLPSDRERPVMLFLNYFDAHEPYLPPTPFDTRFGSGRQKGRLSPLHRWLYDRRVGHAPLDPSELREEIDAYDGSLAYVDAMLGAMSDTLAARWNRETLFVVTADHGEEFGEHRVLEHGYSLYLPAARVPLILAGTAQVPQGTREQAAVSIRDLPRTVAVLLGDTKPPFPGQSLTQWWQAPSQPALPVLTEVHRSEGQPDWFPTSKGDLVSITDGSYRYIRNGDGTEELYNLNEDVWEQRNLIADIAFRATLQAFRAQLRELR